MGRERMMTMTSWMGAHGGRVGGWQCDDCGGRFEDVEVGQAHLRQHERDDQEELEQLRADVEAAIEKADAEGYERALLQVFGIVEGQDLSVGMVNLMSTLADMIERSREARA